MASGFGFGFGQGFSDLRGTVQGFGTGFTKPLIPVGFVAGLKRDTYAGYFNDDLAWFNGRAPSATDYQTSVIEDPITDDGSNYSRRWTGYFRPATSETYTFYLSSDDSSWMWLGDSAISGWNNTNELIDNGGLHGATEASGAASLVAGVVYPVQIFYGESGGGDVLTFSYSTPTISKTTNVTGLVYYNSLSTDSSYRGF